MKLSEISYREYLAIEFLPAFMRYQSALGSSEKEIAESNARYAFVYADAFLRVAGQENDRIAQAEKRAADAETKFEVLQSIHVNMGEDFASRIALAQIWELLGVDNQTAAMLKLKAVLSGYHS